MQQLTLQSLITILALISGLIGGYVHIHVRVKSLEIQVKRLEKNDDNSGNKFDMIMEKIEEVGNKTTDKFEVLNQKFNELLVEFTKIKK